jgi:hypothetical protein
LVEIDNKLSVCDEQVKDWETNAQAILKETSNDVDDNDRPEAAEEPCISIPTECDRVSTNPAFLKHF